MKLLNKEAFAPQILFKERNQNLRVSILNVNQHNGVRQMMIKFRKFTVPIFCYYCTVPIFSYYCTVPIFCYYCTVSIFCYYCTVSIFCYLLFLAENSAYKTEILTTWEYVRSVLIKLVCNINLLLKTLFISRQYPNVSADLYKYNKDKLFN